MGGYTPLFGEIVYSSVWNESPDTCKVWVTMMALADMDGNIQASIAGLAPVARVSLAKCEKAVKILSSPDPHSRTKDEDGKRIIAIDGGFHLVNHRKYRQKAKNRAEYYREWREKKKNQKEKETTNSNSNSETARNNQTVAQHVSFYTIENVGNACIANEIPESNAESYFHHYNSQSWLKGNGQRISNLQSHMAKRWNKSKQCWDFDEKRQGKLPVIVGKTCSKCTMPAVYKDTSGSYDFYYCTEHLPEKIKNEYC